ncbi:MAG: hypothetical protein ACM3VT_10465 [Solirubrobacterales bacterium]
MSIGKRGHVVGQLGHFQTRGNEAVLRGPMEKCIEVHDILVESDLLDLATTIQNELVQSILVDPFGGIRPNQPFQVPERQQGFID